MLCQLKALGAIPGSNGQSGRCNQMLKHGKFLDILLGIQGPTLLVSFKTGSFWKLCCVASLSHHHFLLSALYPVNTCTQVLQLLPASQKFWLWSEFSSSSPRITKAPCALSGPALTFWHHSVFGFPFPTPACWRGAGLRCFTLASGPWTVSCSICTATPEKGPPFCPCEGPLANLRLTLTPNLCQLWLLPLFLIRCLRWTAWFDLPLCWTMPSFSFPGQFCCISASWDVARMA